MEKIFAIYDSDIPYTTRFMEYFKDKKVKGFEISAFTKKENLEAFLTNHKIEILLLGEELTLDDTPGNHIKYLFRLAENKMDDIQSVYRYQPVQSMISEMLKKYAHFENDILDEANIKSKKIISIFSPRPSAETLSYAWSISIQLSDHEKTLFIPMELLPVPFLSIADDSGLSLSEFIYYLKENPSQIIKLENELNHIGNLSYFSGTAHGLDLLTLNCEDIHRWAEKFFVLTDYHYVVFYIAFYSEAAIELMKISDSVLILTKDTFYDKALLKEWEEQMERTGKNIMNWQANSHVVNKNPSGFQQIQLPAEDHWNGIPISLQELAGTTEWSVACEYIKEGGREEVWTN